MIRYIYINEWIIIAIENRLRIENRFRAGRSRDCGHARRCQHASCFTHTRARAVERCSRLHCRVSVNMQDTYALTVTDRHYELYSLADAPGRGRQKTTFDTKSRSRLCSACSKIITFSFASFINTAYIWLIIKSACEFINPQVWTSSSERLNAPSLSRESSGVVE